MFKIDIITVGKLKSPWIKEGVAHYKKLVSKYATVRVVSVKEGDSASLPEERVKDIEGERILEKVEYNCLIFALDEKGHQTSSVELAGELDNYKQGIRKIQYLIGGAFGLSEHVKQHANVAISLSKMTFPHELTLLLLLEQLYRAYSITAGSKYHK